MARTRGNMNIWRDRLNDLGNAVFGFCEIALADTTATAVVDTGLPQFALFAGVFDIYEAWNNQEKLSQVSRGLRLGAGIFSAVEGIENFSSFALGAPGGGLLPIALAVRAGVDLFCAMEKFSVKIASSGDSNRTPSSPPGIADVIDVLKKAIAFTGWCLVACGNPLGWGFLLASATLSFFSRAQCLGGQGLFSKQQQAGSNTYQPNDAYNAPSTSSTSSTL